MRALPLVLLPLVLTAAFATASLLFARGPASRLSLGGEIAVEFRFARPVAVVVEVRAPGGGWAPCGYAILCAERSQLSLPRVPGEARITIGVDGVLHDAATGTDLADAVSRAFSVSAGDRPLTIRGASTSASVHTVAGTLLVLSLEHGQLTTSAERLAGGR